MPCRTPSWRSGAPRSTRASGGVGAPPGGAGTIQVCGRKATEELRGFSKRRCRSFSLSATFWLNPQFKLVLKNPDMPGQSDCSFLVGLMQKDRRKKRRDGEDMETIGFAIYEVRFATVVVLFLWLNKSDFYYLKFPEAELTFLLPVFCPLQVPREVRWSALFYFLTPLSERQLPRSLFFSLSDGRQVRDPSEARLFPHPCVQRALRALRQPEGGQLAAPTTCRRICHRPIHVRATQRGRLCP